MAIRVLPAADSSITRAGLETLLHRDPNLAILAAAADGPHILARCREQRPDVLLLAIRRSVGAAEALVRTIRRDPEMLTTPAILVLGERVDQLALHLALDAGANGYLPAATTPSELVSGIYRVFAGRQVLPDLDAEVLVRPSALAVKERLILYQVANGLPNKAIAQRQGISVRTVSNHLQHIFLKLGASNRVEAIVRARHYGILPPD